MKLTIPKLKAQLKSGSISGVFLFYGEETYIMSSYTNIIKQACETDFPEFNYMEFSEENYSYDMFSDFVMSYPTMSDKKLAVLKKSGALCDSENQKPLTALLSALPEHAVVVFVEDSLARAKKDIVSAIDKSGCITEFVRQTPSDLRAWVNKKLAVSGKKMRIDDTEYLVGLCGCSLEKLNVECAKLVAASDGEIITRDDIDSLVAVPTEYKIFAMSDNLLNKNANAAFALLKEFKINKEQPTEIIALIYASVSEILMFKLCGGNAADFLAPNRKWLAGKYRGKAASIDKDKLRSTMKLCNNYDRQIKSGMIEPYTALELIMSHMLK